MSSSDFAQKLLHDLRLRKERMANTQNSDMYCNSRKNFKGCRETKTLEVGPKTGSRYRNSSNSQRTTAKPQSANQIVPYGGRNHSGQVTDLSMALAYAFDNRGKLKRLDIASNGPMMKILQQIGRKSTQQRFEIQWQSTNQFPTLTNLHINEISKGAQKLNQLLRACSNGGININNDSIEIGKELWKGAMELEQSLRMLVSLQEASSDNMTNPQRKSRLRLLDDNGDSEDDSANSLEKQKKVECPVFSFDKPSKNTKASVQKLTIHTHLEDRNSKPESHMSITSISTPHRRTVSSGSEINTSQLTTSSTSKHNAARLPNVIAKLMGLEEIPQNSNPKVSTDSSASQQRSRDSISTHTSPKSSKNAEVKIDYTRPATKPVNQIRMQSNQTTAQSSQKIEPHKDTFESTKTPYTALDREKPNWRIDERQGAKNYVQESKTAISKINELQTRSMYLVQGSKTQNDVRKETHDKSIKQKLETAEFTMLGNRSLKTSEKTHPETQGSSNQVTREAEINKLQLSQKKHRNVDLQQTNMLHQPHGKKLKAENRSQTKANHRNEYRKGGIGGENMHNSRIIARDMKILQKQLPARKEKAEMKSAENVIVVGPKAQLSNEQNKNRAGEYVSKNSGEGKKSSMNVKLESEMTKERANSCMEVRSETKEMDDMKPPKVRPTAKANKEISKAVIAPRDLPRPLKPHESTSRTVNQNKRDKFSVSKAATSEKGSILKTTESTQETDEPRHPPTCVESQQIEDAHQMDSGNHTVQKDNSQQQKAVIEITTGNTVDVNISNIYNDHQEMSTYEVIKALVVPTDGQDDCKLSSCYQQKQQMPIKVEKKEPLTEDEMFLKQKLILSHLFLNTAEALFKLNIPISILNYASDQMCEARDCKVILDCGYELLKRKGRRKVEIIYNNNVSVSCTHIKSLDDLVRQLHKDFEALRFYGTNEKDAYDYANSILKMLERDIYNTHPDLNSMWDFGWNKEMFPRAHMDEVICNIEELMLNELINELVYDCL